MAITCCSLPMSSNIEASASRDSTPVTLLIGLKICFILARKLRRISRIRLIGLSLPFPPLVASVESDEISCSTLPVAWPHSGLMACVGMYS
ncbi:hypothetical protein TYRP_001575 [Tyrophagus putrescentiae]|nr:hypothetical protein TYRP_001575 [Tyrophagus putrescentiae]